MNTNQVRRFGWLIGFSALLCTLLLPPATLAADALPDLNQLIKAAKPGETITLPAGKYSASVVLHDGICLRGAGYDKTFIDASNAPVAVMVNGGKGSKVEDLAIRTQGSVAIEAAGTSDVQVRRVLIHGGAMGVRFDDVADGRIENVIIDGSMSGVSLGNVRDSAVVNCTLVDNAAVGLSIAGARHVALFNNLVLDAGTAAVVGGENTDLHVDYNIYVALFAGKASGSARRSPGPWRDVSGGLDAHSVQVPVQLADRERDDFRPVSRLDWSPDRSTVSDWGMAELDKFAAPTTDIDGHPRIGAVDVGAYEVPPLQGFQPDATFTISDDDGTKSAGLFTSGGRLVHYLFQDLPLKKGTYGYLLPTRTELGDPIAPGDYQLRVVESKLRWKDRGITANSGLSGSNDTTDQDHTQYVCFTPDGSLLLGSGWNERGENLRNLDYRTRKPHWAFPGQSMMNGLCVGDDGFIYCLRDGGAGQYILSRIDAGTGAPAVWPDGRPQVVLKAVNSAINGIAVMGGKLYAADSQGNRVYITALDHPAFEQSTEVASPMLPVADRKHKRVWVVSDRQKLVAIDAGGQVCAKFAGVEKPLGVAVAGDRMVIASAADGKIHFLDCSDSLPVRPLKTLGRGDGPFGPIIADRFFFQEHALNPATGWVCLDLDEKGTLAVRDYQSRTLIFDAEGKLIYQSFAQFGNWPAPAFFEGDKETRFFDSNGTVSWFVDAVGGTWRPDTFWGYPPGKNRGAVGAFSDSGKQFGVFQFEDNQKHSGILIVRYENFIGKPVVFYRQEKVPFPPGTTDLRDMWVAKHDTNHDGVIDDKDEPGTPVLDVAGKPINWQMATRFFSALPDGSLMCEAATNDPPGIGFIWKRKGLDHDGIPVYEFGPDSRIAVKQRIIPSAYDFAKTEDVGNQSESALASNGDYLATFQFVHSPNGMGLSNSGGIDLACFDRSGEMRWFRPMNDFGPVQGVKTIGNFVLSSWGHQAEWMAMNEDGLSLGHLGFPATVGWTGYWVDHPTQYKLFTGNDGRLQVLVGDYMQNAQHWLSLENYDNYVHSSADVKITPQRAHELAFSPSTPYRLMAKPPQPRVIVRKLNQPFAIDGKLEKWRAAGITPQIVMTPVTGQGIDSPKDASAVIRLAYKDQDLYVQILRFDDVVTFHQPVSKSHLQDTMEMSLNGFFDGFQFSVSKFTDTGPTIVRRRFFFDKLTDLTPAEHAPRVVEVLPNAKSVEERRLIEAIYGVDMSDCKVIVTEFKLPIDKVTYHGAEEAIFPVKSGVGFWIGFMIDDNDTPGADIQKLIVWPATYGTFNPKETGAWATFE